MRRERPPGTSRRPADAGLTLIELLVALTLLALLTAALPSMMQLVSRAWKTSAAIATVAPSTANLNVLEHRLAEAMPLYSITENGERTLAFRGTASALSFIAPLSQGPAGAGLYRFEVYAVPFDEGAASRSMLRVSPFSPAQPATAAPAIADERSLTRGPEVMSFRYFGSAKSGEPALWLPEWPGNNALPQMVELRLLNAAGAGAERPPLRVALKLGRRD